MLAKDDSGPGEPIVRRLNALRRLSEKGIATLRAVVRERPAKAAAGEDLVCEGDRCDSVRLFLSGWACRYKALEDGRRQILSFILPGDTCDAYIYLLSSMDHSIATLTPVTFCELDRTAFERLMAADASVAEAFHSETLTARAIQREWGINLGRRDALERVAHIICELFERLRAVGLTDGHSFAFPVTQMDLADATGLSTVHLNRTLQELRGAGLITLRDRSLTIVDLQALRGTAMFNPNYLHLDRR
ncbi:MAG: Crp/Fnr family transcriptional regulator [Bradyrhizobium sp.]|nr:Crp/Fnr family transcriptional regulator [Bradyrhizobium sp.]